MKQILFTALLIPTIIFSQDGAYRVGINTETPKATLQVDKAQSYPFDPVSETQPQGVLFPEFSTSERARFQGTEVGTLIYNKDKLCIEIFTGMSSGVPQWKCLPTVYRQPYAHAIKKKNINLNWQMIEGDEYEFLLEVASFVPEGTLYEAYTSPEVSVKTIDGTYRNFQITYPAGVTDGKPIVAKLNVTGGTGAHANKYLQPMITQKSDEFFVSIPLEFNGFVQEELLTFDFRVNAVQNTEHSQIFTYPIYSKNGASVMLMELGAYYAKQATTQPNVLWEWAVNNHNLTTTNYSNNDLKAKGSRFQWQRRADGHELVNWLASPTTSNYPYLAPISNGYVTNSLWIAPNNKRYQGQSWVKDAIAQSSNNKNLWHPKGANNPCPTGWHVPFSDKDFNDLLKQDKYSSIVILVRKLYLLGEFYNGDGNFRINDESYKVGGFWVTVEHVERISGSSEEKTRPKYIDIVYLDDGAFRDNDYQSYYKDQRAIRCFKD